MDEKEPNVQVIGGKGGKGGRGGNVILSSGALGEVFDIVVKKLREGLEEYGGNTLIAGGVGNGQPAGDIIFNAGNLEVLRIDPKGDFFYKGEKLDHNEDVAFVLRAWLGYCVIAMKENRERFKGEERIGELEAQLREANKVAERAQFVEKGKLRADTNLEAWRKWASETLGKYPGLGEADSTLREGVTKHIAYLRKGGAKILQEAGLVSIKDEDVPELFAAGQRARALEDDLSAWREWACLQSGMTYVGEADSWLRVRVQDALKKSPQKIVAEALPLTLTDEEILFVRDAFKASKRTPYVCKP